MNTQVIEIPERLDITNVADIKGQVREAFHSDAARVVFDFKPCRKVDSTGLSTIVTAIRLSKMTRKEFRIANVSGEVRILLQITRFDQLVDIYESLESALA